MQGVAVYTCRLCKYVVELDDAICPTKSGWCICLRCYNLATDQATHVLRSLQDEINREETA